MNKRDRYVEVLRHRTKGFAALFPYVCFQGGTSRGFGEAMKLADCSAARLGKAVVKLLKECRKADVEAIKKTHEAEVEVYREQGNQAYVELVQQTIDSSWRQLFDQHPALAKGPGTWLRQFDAVNVIEPDKQKSRRIVRVERSKYRGSTTEGESRRVPCSRTATALGEAIIEALSEA